VAVACVSCLRFLFPKAYYEPPRVFPAGNPADLRVGPPTLIPAHRVFLSRQKAGVSAMTAVCTHLGCTVEWFGNDRSFHCPCHGSIYNADGSVVRGPAQRELEHYAVGLAPTGELRVDRRRSVPAGQRLKI
jgi:cytochrome b6-f complex iron-sulfur subunit